MLTIEVSDFMPKEDVMTFVEASGFFGQCDQYIQHYWNEFTKDLSPQQLDEVREWWGPGWPAYFPRETHGLRKDFYETISKEAHNAISLLISYGLG